MMTIRISGCKTPERAHQVDEALGSKKFNMYRKGSAPELYVDVLNREEAHLAVVSLNLLPGIRADILQDLMSFRPASGASS